MNNCLLISDAAKEVKVESHVLRYWEEELHLPIKRNELGHRYYTEADVQRFKQIKSMKERGLQLKAIKMILKGGRLDVLSESTKPEGAKAESTKMEGTKTESTKPESTETEHTATEYIGTYDEGRIVVPTMAIDIVDRQQPLEGVKEAGGPQITPLAADEAGMVAETKEEKSRKLQWLLQEMIRQAVQENNAELCRELKESVIKELDYQFRMQEEREEARDKRLAERDEAYYKRMDELLRRKSRYKAERGEKRKQEREGFGESSLRESGLRKKGLGEKVGEGTRERQQEPAVKADKKKRHFF